MLINIHTHRPDPSAALALLSLHDGFERAATGISCSIGLHPWYLDEHTADRQLERLAALAPLPNVRAVGECGLDRLTATGWALQEGVFLRQVALARQVQKPLILHCVRAHEELMQLLGKQLLPKPAIVHGFNRRWTIARQLLDAGFFLSFGAALLHHTTVQEVFRRVPEDRYFLETDDAPVPVREVYEAAAALRNTAVEQVISQVRNNFAAVF